MSQPVCKINSQALSEFKLTTLSDTISVSVNEVSESPQPGTIAASTDVSSVKNNVTNTSKDVDNTATVIDPTNITDTATKLGFFGIFGGKYVAETLRPAIEELDQAFHHYWNDADFRQQLHSLQANWVGRPTPLVYAENITNALGGAKIYIKLEGLAHTGAHKINNALGQALLAKKLGKTRIIAETGAGQHGVATAAVCAKLGLQCVVYMGAVDIARQYPNVYAMKMYGAQVVKVDSGSQTLKDAVNAALRDWAASHQDTHYLIGSALGPAPFPEMARCFQSVIGEETCQQLTAIGENPDLLIACVGGGSNAIGFFSPHLPKLARTDSRDNSCMTNSVTTDNSAAVDHCAASDLPPRLIGVEAGGKGDLLGDHAARMSGSGRLGIAQGYKSMFLVDKDGQLGATHSISAGLDYPGLGPELAYYGISGRIEFTRASDIEALQAVQYFARHEGMLFALESAHAAAVALQIAPQMLQSQVIVVNMSGRGDKDMFITAREFYPQNWKNFLTSEVNRD